MQFWFDRKSSEVYKYLLKKVRVDAIIFLFIFSPEKPNNLKFICDFQAINNELFIGTFQHYYVTIYVFC